MYEFIRTNVVNDETVYVTSGTTGLVLENQINIKGVGSFKLNTLSDVVVHRGKAAASQFNTLLAADLGISNLPTGGERDKIVTMWVEITVNDDAAGAEWTRSELQYGRRVPYQLTIVATDTPATVLNKIYFAFLGRLQEFGEFGADSLVVENHVVNTSFDIYSTEVNAQFSFSFEDSVYGDINGSGGVTPYVSNVIVPVVGSSWDTPVIEQESGVNTGKYLNSNVAMLTDVSVRPYGPDATDRPDLNAIYTSITFNILVNRKDLFGGAAIGQPVSSGSTIVLYFKEVPGVVALDGGSASALKRILESVVDGTLAADYYDTDGAVVAVTDVPTLEAYLNA